MKALVCEMCGSQDLVKQDGMYVCQNCGTKYAPEEAKKLLIEVSGSVKVDNSAKLDNYYKLAREAATEGNAADAQKYYDLIRQENADDWEAQFYAVYYSAAQAKIIEMPHASKLLKSTAERIISMIGQTAKDKNSKLAAAQSINAVATDSWKLFSAFAKTDNNHHEQFHSDGSELVSYLWEHVDTYATDLVIVANKVLEYSEYNSESLLPLSIGMRKEANLVWADGWKTYCNHITGLNKDSVNSARNYYQDRIDTQTEIIRKQDSGYTPPTLVSREGCYVATAIYGSYDCPEVWTLRRYRDYTLAETWLGRLFITLYYAVSPTLVKWFGDTQWFRNMWKPKLDKMVERLNKEGVADTPYQDRQW